MNTLLVRAQQIRRIVTRYGWAGGVRVVFRLAQAGLRAQTALVGIRLPGYGATMYMRPRSSDRPVFGQVMIDEEYDFDYGSGEVRFIIDAGANVGYSSLYFAERFPNARVVAIEPERSNFELLTKNTEAYESILRIQAALWSTRTFVGIENPTQSSWEFRVKEGALSRIPTVTIPELLSTLGVDHIDILKLDVEGAEKNLFSAGCEEWLPRVSAIVIELHDRFEPGCTDVFKRAIADTTYVETHNGENTLIRFGRASDARA